MRRNTRIALAVVALLVIGAGAWYAGFPQRSAAAVAKTAAPVPVRVATAVVKNLPVVLEVVGRGEAYETVSLKARVDGQVAAVLFTEGQHVKQGEELIRLDTTDFTLRLRQAEANAARDEAQLAKAHADTVRYLALQQRGFVSEEKVNEMRSAEAVAGANLRADQAAVELARSQLSYASIRAPFAGVVGARLVFPGSAVKINDTILAVVNRVRPLYASFAVPERYLPRLKSALAAGRSGSAGCNGCLQVTISAPGSDGKRFTGQLRFIDNAVDSATGTIQMKALVDNQDEALTPGQFLNLTLQLAILPDAIVVPDAAVQQGPEGALVFVVTPESVTEVRKVEVATRFGGLSAIANGIQAGETVVIDGQLRLTQGTPVEAKAPSASAPPPAQVTPEAAK